MIVRELPTTCFGENLKIGVLRIAEYCMVESVCLLVIFTICSITDVAESWNYPAYYDLIPVFLLLISVLKVIANVILYKGVTLGNVNYLRIWVYVYGINTVVMMLFMTGTGIAMGVIFPPKFNAYVAGAQCMLFIFYCGLFKYFCQVVYAYKCEVEQGRDSMLRHIVDDQQNIV